MVPVLQKLIIKLVSIWDKCPYIIANTFKKGSEGRAVPSDGNGGEFIEMRSLALVGTNSHRWESGT